MHFWWLMLTRRCGVMPVDDLEVLVRQLDGALHEGVHVQVLVPARVAGRGEKGYAVSEATERNRLNRLSCQTVRCVVTHRIWR